jgi:hypothetical protein
MKKQGMGCEWVRRGTCIGFVRKTGGKMPLGRPRRRWVDNIEMFLMLKT